MLQRNISGLGFPENWNILKSFTSARVALGRTGNSVPLNEQLNFKMAHAQARDAVYSSLNIKELEKQLQPLFGDIILVKSKVSNREEYLKRPDLGRQLHSDSIAILKDVKNIDYEVAIIISDGLSANAANNHALNVLNLLIPKFNSVGYKLAPLVITENGRVAIADPIGELLQVKLTINLIGERPGLSCPDSLGAYFTYAPKTGLTDEARNCISNICPHGLSCHSAADKIFHLTRQIMIKRQSGVLLKDEMKHFME